MSAALGRAATGVLAATVLPLAGDGHTIDEATFRQLVRGLAGIDGVNGVVVNALAGEGSQLTPDEAAAVVRAAVAELDGAAPVVASIRCDAPRTAQAEVERLAAAGAAGVLVQAPPDFGRGVARAPAVAIRYFEAVCRAGLPVVVFQHQVHSGRSYPTPLLLEILALDGVAGVKETTWDVASYERDVRAIRASGLDVSVYCANDTLLLPCMAAVPADGFLLGLASLVPHLVVQLWDALAARDLAAAQAAYDRLWPVVSAVYADPPILYYARAKAALRLMGVLPFDGLREPMAPLDEPERRQVRAALEQAGLLPAGVPAQAEASRP